MLASQAWFLVLLNDFDTFHTWTSNLCSFSISGVPELVVYTEDISSGLVSEHLRFSGNMGNGWNMGQVNIEKYAQSEYQIKMVGIVGYNHTSDVALDDTQLTAGQCGCEY